MAGYIARASACAIEGADVGTCMPFEDVERDMPFCAPFVRYPVCVPASTSRVCLVDGVCVASTDAAVRTYVSDVIARRTQAENGLSAGLPSNTSLPAEFLVNVGVGDGGRPARRFTWGTPSDCPSAFTAMACYAAFPRCSHDGRAMRTCRSACQNLMRACNVPTDLHRCGSASLFGGDAPEGTRDDQIFDPISSTPLFLRAVFPGLPFEDIWSWLGGPGWTDPRTGLPADTPVTCTPSIKGHTHAAAATVALALALLVSLTTLWV